MWEMSLIFSQVDAVPYVAMVSVSVSSACVPETRAELCLPGGPVARKLSGSDLQLDLYYITLTLTSFRSIQSLMRSNCSATLSFLN